MKKMKNGELRALLRGTNGCKCSDMMQMGHHRSSLVLTSWLHQALVDHTNHTLIANGSHSDRYGSQLIAFDHNWLQLDRMEMVEIMFSGARAVQGSSPESWATVLEFNVAWYGWEHFEHTWSFASWILLSFSNTAKAFFVTLSIDNKINFWQFKGLPDKLLDKSSPNLVTEKCPSWNSSPGRCVTKILPQRQLSNDSPFLISQIWSIHLCNFVYFSQLHYNCAFI